MPRTKTAKPPPSKPPRKRKLRPKAPGEVKRPEQHPFLGCDMLDGVATTPVEESPSDDIRRFIAGDAPPYPVHQSFMTDLWRCPRYFVLKNRFGLKPKGQGPTAADIGTFFHKAIEVLYNGNRPFDEAVAAVHLLADEKKVALTDYYNRAKLSDLGESLCQLVDKSADLGLVMARIYRDEPKNNVDPNRFILVSIEQDIEVWLPEIRHTAKCRLDQVLYCRQSEGLYLWDYKTVSDKQPLSDYASGLEYDFQGRFYRLALSRWLEEHGRDYPIPGLTGKSGRPLTLADVPVRGLVIAAMNKPSIRQKQGQVFEDFLVECTDYYAGRTDSNPQPKQRTKGGAPAYGDDGEPLWILGEDGTPKLYPRWDHSLRRAQWVEDPPMQLFLVRFNEEVYPQELRQISSMTARAMRCRPTLSNFPRFGRLTGQCSMMYNRPCPFRELCQKPPSYWQGVVDARFDTGVVHGQDDQSTSEEA